MLKKYKERLYLSVTWLKWLPTGMESKTRVTSKSNKVNSQKLEFKPRVQPQMYDDSIGTTTYCMIICMKSRMTSFYMTLQERDVFQLNVNFWLLTLLDLGANLVLDSIPVGNHLSQVTPESKRSLYFSWALHWLASPLRVDWIGLDLLSGTGVSTALRIVQWPTLFLTRPWASW